MYWPASCFGDIKIAAMAFKVFPVSPQATHRPSNAEQDIDDHDRTSLAFDEQGLDCVARFSSKSYSG